ncbi:MAG TPA: hypothetical protein IAA18_00605 [Candidatus Pseudomonas excrementavium]|nr:hypothetical protein [Candidatus Pseudomonas excrementavium]
MAELVSPHLISRAILERPKITLRFRLLRDGEVTPTPKTIIVYRGWESIGNIEMCFHAELGEWTHSHTFDLATLLDQGSWLVAGLDDAPPRRTRAVYFEFSESADLMFNITGLESSGPAGSPAKAKAMVYLDSAPADREVVMLERPPDGQWRVAGYGQSDGGALTLDLRVTDGAYFAVALDEHGLLFQPNLTVPLGATIRPSDFRGWLYRITEAGQLPSREPQWWPVEGENASRQLGTARAVAVRYYRPLAHGPIPIEII